jgi:hypothetical protein
MNFRWPVLFLICVSLNCQAQEWRNVSCLTQEQQKQMFDLAAKLIADLNIEQNLAAYKEVSSVRLELQPAEQECQRRRGNPLQLLGEVFNGCAQTIQRYKSLIRQEEDLARNIASSQNLVLQQLTLQRRTLPACP